MDSRVRAIAIVCAVWDADEAAGTLGVHAFDIGVGIFRVIAAHRREASADLRDPGGVQPIFVGPGLHFE